jgi:hypothetical protein
MNFKSKLETDATCVKKNKKQYSQLEHIQICEALFIPK